jgi:hypothetical protein
VVPSLAFGLFVFLACAFVPLKKKYAGILVLVLSFIFIGLGTYQYYTDDDFLRKDYLIRYIVFSTCIVIGFMFGYKMFKQNRWTSC